jgi:hypothetical protein
MSPRALVFPCATLLGLLGCASSIPVPETGSHTRDEQTIAIPYPPPPARVEVVPAMPKDIPGAVWVDGEWQWKGRRWVWSPGQWQAPLLGGYYAPPTVVRFEDGTLEYYAGTWKAGPAKK